MKKVGGTLIVNPWVNGTDEDCIYIEKPPVTTVAPVPCRPGEKCLDAELTLSPPIELEGEVLNCELLATDFNFAVKFQLRWDRYPDKIELSETIVKVFPNGEKNVEWELEVPSDIESKIIFAILLLLSNQNL